MKRTVTMMTKNHKQMRLSMANASDKDEPPATRHPTQLVPRWLPSTSHSEWGHIALTPGHYYPVIMCCSAWLHLLFVVESLMLEESNFTWWMVIWGREAVPAQCLASELCSTKCNRCPYWLPPLPTSPIYYKSLSFTSWVTLARAVRTFSLVIMCARAIHYHAIYLFS